ncbi:MAG: helix-turn-helix domain-containing protein [Pseudomonadota bacterium]|nr:helix-turn-helix domain-containing protein [Pseudomonadota bacterium]
MRAPEGRVRAAGDLAAAPRTIAGLMGQLGMAGISDEAAVRFLQAQGLPRRAAEDPDFPLTLAQELAALQVMLRQAPRAPGEIIQAFSLIGVNHYGVLGLAMQHAPTLLVALERLLALPELSWGHCRITVLSYAAGAVVQFEPPILPHGDSALANYCLWKDLFSILRVILDVLGPGSRPQEIGLPGPPLGELGPLPAPLRFGAAEAQLVFGPRTLDQAPRLASPLPFKRYDALARRFARQLGESVGVGERVRRLLWAYQPPPRREEVAAMLELEPRTLARRLRQEGTGFQQLLEQMLRERAQAYLRQTDDSIAQISDRLGYADPAAFSRAFQKWFGTPPSRWRADAQGGRC